MALNRYNWIEISQKNLAHNLSHIAERLSGSVKIMAVIKDNAYGHDAAIIAQCLENLTSGIIQYFALHSVQEALCLRETGIKSPLLVIGPTSAADFALASEFKIAMTAYSFESLKEIINWTRRHLPLKIHLKFDTGMSRLGFHPNELAAVIAGCRAANIAVEGVFSHMPDAKSPETSSQIDQFSHIAEAIKKELGLGVRSHLANSLGTLVHPEAHSDLVRVGLSLYGYSISQEYSETHLKAVLSLGSRIVQIRTIHAGSTVGYNRRHRVDSTRIIAVVPIGYGDGYLRVYQKFGKVIVGAQFFPIVGDICMDMMMIDITAAKQPIGVGDKVILIGEGGDQKITAYDISLASGFIPYEILTLLSPAVSRVLV